MFKEDEQELNALWNDDDNRPISIASSSRVRDVSENSSSLFIKQDTTIQPSTSFIDKLFSRSSIWITVIFSGLAVGFLAAAIDVVIQWLGDIKVGYCSGRFYLNRRFCCWADNAPDDHCPDWTPWSWTFLHHKIGEQGISGWLISYFIYILFSTAFASAATLLVVGMDASHSVMSGISELKVILGGFQIPGFFSLKTLTIKIIGVCLSVGSGLWVGKEGPLVHVACCLAYQILLLTSKDHHDDIRIRRTISAAASAGISVAFGAPIGGVLFTLEQLVYFSDDYILWHSFVSAMMAAAALQWFNPFRTGKLVLFQVIYDRIWHTFELGAFALIGILGGLYGAGILNLNERFAKFRSSSSWIQNHPILESSIIAAMIAVVSFPNFYTQQESSVLLSYLVEECPLIPQSTGVLSTLCNPDRWAQNVGLLLLAYAVGFIFTAYCYGLSVPAGILMPSMLVGALGGRIIGAIMHTWQANHSNFKMFDSCPADGTCITPGVYALVGAAAALTGTTRLTVSSVVIMFELTGALTYVLPIMIGVMISKWVADSFGRRGIYEAVLSRRNYPYLERLDSSHPIPEIPASEIMIPVGELESITSTMTVGDISSLISSTNHEGYPVVLQEKAFNNLLAGYITREDIQKTLNAVKNVTEITNITPCVFNDEQSDRMRDTPALDLRGIIDIVPHTTSPKTSMLTVVSLFESMGYKQILFTEKGELQGQLTFKDVSMFVKSLADGNTTTANYDYNDISYTSAETSDEAALLRS